MNAVKLLVPSMLLAALLPLVGLSREVKAQQFRSTVCSFWIKGNPVASRQCRVNQQGGRVFSISYLADSPQGEITDESITVGRNEWKTGDKPECLVYGPTGYTVCAR